MLKFFWQKITSYSKSFLNFNDIKREKQKIGYHTRLLLLPLWFGLGIVGFFLLKHEPTAGMIGIVAVAALVSLLLAIFWNRLLIFWLSIFPNAIIIFSTHFFSFWLFLLFFQLGFLTAAFHTQYQILNSPRQELMGQLYGTKFITGEIIKISGNEKERLALTFKVMAVDDKPVKPFLIRLTDPKRMLSTLPILNNSTINNNIDSFNNALTRYQPSINYEKILALLNCPMVYKLRIFPLPDLVSLGSYNLGRDWWFRGYKASAIFLATPAPSRTCFNKKPNIANNIKQIILKDFPPDVRGMILAMITGDRSEISHQQFEQYRLSGLVHLISISGVHMGLIAGLSFAIARLLLVVFLPRGNGYAHKQWSAVVAFLITLGYFLLAEYSAASLRALLMTSVFLIGVMVGQKAISLKNLAIAMLLVLLYRPVDIFNPGFQLSMVSMLVLVGLFEAWWRPIANQIEQGLRTTTKDTKTLTEQKQLQLFLGRDLRQQTTAPKGFWQKLQLFFYGIGFSGLLITALTLPITLYHFNNASPLGILANMAAIPLMDLLGLPLLFIKVLLMPLKSLFVYFLPPSEWAWFYIIPDMIGQNLNSIIIIVFRILNNLAEMFRGNELTAWQLPAIHPFALFGYGMAVYLFIMLSGVWRGLAVFLLFIALISFLLSSEPLLLMTDGGNKWLARLQANNKTIWVSPNRDSFVINLWRNQYGITKLTKTLPAPSHCFDGQCRLQYLNKQDLPWLELVWLKQYPKNLSAQQKINFWRNICQTLDQSINNTKNHVDVIIATGYHTTMSCPALILDRNFWNHHATLVIKQTGFFKKLFTNEDNFAHKITIISLPKFGRAWQNEFWLPYDEWQKQNAIFNALENSNTEDKEN